MGVVMALLIVTGVLSAYVGTRRAPTGTVVPGPGSLRDQLRIVAGRARLPAAARRRSCSRRWRPAACSPASTTSRPTCSSAKGAATILFVCFVGPALVLTPAWAALGDPDRQEARVPRWPRSSSPPARAAVLAQSAPAAVLFAAAVLVGVGYAGCQVFPMAMLPDAAAVDARRTGSNRAGVYTGVWTAGETLGLALGPGRLRAGAGARRLPVVDAGDVAQPDSALTAIALGFSRPAGAADPAQPGLADALLARRRGGGPMTRRPGPAAGDAGRRPAGARRPHARLRLRLRAARRRPDRPRGGGGVRRLERPRPDRVPVAAGDGERPGRLRLRPARRAAGRRRHRDLRRHRVGAAGGAGRAGQPARRRAADDGAAVDRARRVPQGRALLRRRGGGGAGRAGLPRRRGRHGGGDRRPHRARGRPSAPSYAHGVVDPVAGDRRRCGGARGPLPRRRVHRRLGAAVRRPAGARRAAVDVRGRRRHLDLGGHRTSTPTPRRARRCCCTGRRSCGGRSTSRRPTGRATRCSTRPCSRRSRAGRWPAPGRWCSRWATTATCG